MIKVATSTLPNQTGTVSNRFRELDGWRGICALLVALHHFVVGGPLFRTALVQNANLFVDFFFVLSGFVITHAYGGRITTRHEAGIFLVRRIARVWPLHATVLLMLISLEGMRAVLGGTGSERAAWAGVDSWQAIGPNLLLLQAILPPKGLSWNVPSWSISVEISAYIIFAGSLLLFPRRFGAIALALVAVSLFLLASSSTAYVDATHGYGMCRGFAGFFLGNQTYRFRQHWHVTPASLTGLELAAVAGALMFVCVADGHWLPLLAPGVFAIVVWVFSFQGGGLSRLLSRSVPTFLGRVSYSIYMVHYPLVLLTGAACEILSRHFGWQMIGPGFREAEKTLQFGSDWANLLATVAFLATTLLLAAFTYRFVELPGQRWFAPIGRIRV